MIYSASIQARTVLGDVIGTSSFRKGPDSDLPGRGRPEEPDRQVLVPVQEERERRRGGRGGAREGAEGAERADREQNGRRCPTKLRSSACRC